MVVSTSSEASQEIAGSVGSRLIKFFISLHFYVTNSADGPDSLTKSTSKELAKIANRRRVQGSVGAVFLESGLEAALLEFAAHSAILSVTKWDDFAAKYKKSGAIAPEDGPDRPLQVVPCKSRPGYDYDRLEFLGDAILEVVAIKAWIKTGSENAANKTGPSACNQTLMAV
ncbi:hypothetical protein BGX34_001348 [Mortierella sp. NVP85]|nr:hypothetical protein BGX34_001348 [Mortierella sp. NVP85]